MKYDELSCLDGNFSEPDADSGEWKDNFSPPTLGEVVENYRQDAGLRAKIERMLDGDAIKRFYAAVLLWEVERTKAEAALKKLTDDATEVKVQARLGFHIVNTTVGVLARDFLSEQQIRGGNFDRELGLSEWATAVSSEKRKSNRVFDEDSLPKWANVLAARENADEMKRLRDEINRLKNDAGVAEKFYAAVLLNAIDETESRKVLESLLAEETEVGILSGDIMHNRPARQVADEMLYPEKFQPTGSEPSNPIARATKWLEKNFLSRKDGG